MRWKRTLGEMTVKQQIHTYITKWCFNVWVELMVTHVACVMPYLFMYIFLSLSASMAPNIVASDKTVPRLALSAANGST